MSYRTLETVYQPMEGISRTTNGYLAACLTADWAVGAYFSAAFSENSNVARDDMPVYKSLRRAAIAALREAYGLTALKADRVLQVMSEHGTYSERSGVTDAVDYVRTHRTSPAYR